METKKVYEYLITKDWFGNLEKGTRLYYDFGKNGYTYHYEYDNTQNNTKYEMVEHSEFDYFMSLDVAQTQIERENVVPGPELGDFETK